MANWIYITTTENWEITRRTNILGVAARYEKRLSQVTKGDNCLVYTMGSRGGGAIVEPRIVAEYEIASTVFVDDKKLFVAAPHQESETFALRLKLRPVTMFKKPIEFKPLIAKLSFIKNKDKTWGLHLKGKALVQISDSDYNTITSSAT
jgi:predicted RNA-binding protein